MELSKIEQLEKQLADHKIKLAAFEAELNNAKEAQKEKTYTWEESFGENGYWVTPKSEIQKGSSLLVLGICKNVATTEKVCLSHLAACQLSHIIEAINKDFEGDDAYIICCEFDDSIKLYPMLTEYWALPYLKSNTGAECLIKHHTPLLKQYFGVE